jgi:hypothetical protein
MKVRHLGRVPQILCAPILWLGLGATSVHAQTVVQCAQVPCDDVRTVAAATTGVPVEHDFNATAGTTYYVTLTDLGAQFQVAQPLASLKMAITANDALVNVTPIVTTGDTVAATNQLVVDGANSVATNGVGVASFTATTTGAYRFHIVGAPTTGNAPGPIGLQVSATQGGAALQSWSDSIGLPGAPPASAEGILQQTLAVTTAGSFQVSVTDLAFPQALAGAPQLILLQNGSSTPVVILPDPTNNNALTKAVTLATGSYQLYALGLSGTGAPGGLFSASVLPAATGGGAPSFAWTVPTGSTIAIGAAVQLTTGASYTLSLRDLAFPVPLSLVAAVAVDANQGLAAATLNVNGTQSFTASGATGGDTYQIYGVAQAASTPGGGSYSAQIFSSGGAAMAGAAQAVTTPGGTLQGYNFTTDVPTAGSYTATLTDFVIPGALTTADLALVQGGVVVGTPLTSPGSASATLAAGAGSLTLLAFAAPSSSGGGLMDVNLANSSGALIFDQPQGVGAAFKPTQISITTQGSYSFTLADLAWPASFSQSGGQLTGILTQGGNVIGEIFGGGSLTSIAVKSAGNYYLSIIATPTGTDEAGTYALNVGPTPAAPTVSLSADATSVATGGTVHLIWTTTGASSCVASGGNWSGTFTGTQATSGTATSPTISANTTFTLTCSGPGGQTAGNVTVNITAASTSTSSSKGGGGALGEGLLLVLGICLATSRRRLGKRAD